MDSCWQCCSFLGQRDASCGDSTLALSAENHLANLRQLTFGGENAEAYFSFDESRLIYQSTRDSLACDQEFILDLASGTSQIVSPGMGRTTCGYFLPGDERVLFASTHGSGPDCPPVPDFSQGYVWAVYPEYEIYSAATDGSDLRLLSSSPGYDAEATVSPQGDRIVFTSSRSGDLELYSMNVDGSDLRRLTEELGYDGGAFYSFDGKMIVYRAWHYPDTSAAEDYLHLLGRNLVRPSRMEIFVMNADGTGKTSTHGQRGGQFRAVLPP